MYIDIGERIAGKQVGPILLIEGVPSPPPPPRIAKNAHPKKQFTLVLLYEKLVVIFPLLYICLHCDEVILP